MLEARGGGPQGDRRPRRRPRGRSIVLAALIMASWLALGLEPATASPGRIFQLNGASGCTTEAGTEGCATGRNLSGASSAAISPDGRNVYVAANQASSLTTFLRDRRGGTVVQPRSASGCVSETGLGECATGLGLRGAYSVAVSPDGANVYVASGREVAVFARQPSKGVLTQLDGTDGCLSEDAAPGCAPARGLATGSDVAVSPDGRNVYVSGFDSGAVAVFDRDPGSGALTQLPAATGCISATGAEGCSTGRALAGPFSLEVSPSGEYVFVASFFSDAVAVLPREPSTGVLTQALGTKGCVSLGGSEGCAVARGIESPNGVALSPDGTSLYVASSGSDAVAALRVAADGALSQRPGAGGCVSLGGREGCASSGSLNGAFALAVSSEGRNVYAVSQRTVTTLRRKRSGSLVEIGCVTQGGFDACEPGRALEGATSVALAPGGDHAYVTAYAAGGLSAFARDPQSGRVRVRMRGLPRGCARRPFRARVAIDSLLPLRDVKVLLNGRKVGASTEAKLSLHIRPARLSRGLQTLEVKAVDVSGTADRKRERFRRC